MFLNSKIIKIDVTSSSSSRRSLVDLNEETCWFSKHDKFHIITLELEKSYIESVKIDYQLGFQCKTGTVIFCNENETISEVSLGMVASESTKKIIVRAEVTKIIFKYEKSYDFYNRICIYNIFLE